MGTQKITWREQLNKFSCLIHIIQAIIRTNKLHLITDIERTHHQPLGSERAEGITAEDRSTIERIAQSKPEEAKPIDTMLVFHKAIDGITWQ